VAWDAQGKQVALALVDVKDLATGRLTRMVYVRDGSGERVWAVPGWRAPLGLSFSPAGTHLAFLAYPAWLRGRDCHLVIADLRENRQVSVRLPEEAAFAPRPVWSDDGQLLAVPGLRGGTGEDKGTTRRYVWVGDVKGQQIAWLTLPSTPEQDLVCVGWVSGKRTLLGLAAFRGGAESPIPRGNYLWTMDLDAPDRYEYRPLTGEGAQTRLCFGTWKRVGNFVYLEGGQGQGGNRLPIFVVDVVKATISRVPNALGFEGYWSASPDGQWVAMMGRNNTVTAYRRDGVVKSFAVGSDRELPRQLVYWGPGPTEVTVNATGKVQPLTAINLETGAQRGVLGAAD